MNLKQIFLRGILLYALLMVVGIILSPLGILDASSAMVGLIVSAIVSIFALGFLAGWVVKFIK